MAQIKLTIEADGVADLWEQVDTLAGDETKPHGEVLFLGRQVEQLKAEAREVAKEDDALRKLLAAVRASPIDEARLNALHAELERVLARRDEIPF